MGSRGGYLGLQWGGQGVFLGFIRGGKGYSMICKCDRVLWIRVLKGFPNWVRMLCG